VACFQLVDAWQLPSGKVIFGGGRKAAGRFLQLPCGQCVGCRLEYSRQWAVRLVHEAAMHSENAFITLTYSDEHVPVDGSLDYRVFQLFMKRLRKFTGAIRFFMCGEYGDLNWRPHFHALIFGFSFPDRTYICPLNSGATMSRSALLERLWPYGFSSVGDVTFDSAAYVARYCMKKVTGDRYAVEHYGRVSMATGEIYQLMPEFCRMSLPLGGLGADWFRKYGNDVLTRGLCVVNGKEVKAPKSYSKLACSLNQVNLDSDAFERLPRLEEDSTPDRLVAREAVTRARLRSKVRTL